MGLVPWALHALLKTADTDKTREHG